MDLLYYMHLLSTNIYKQVFSDCFVFLILVSFKRVFIEYELQLNYFMQMETCVIVIFLLFWFYRLKCIRTFQMRNWSIFVNQKAWLSQHMDRLVVHTSQRKFIIFSSMRRSIMDELVIYLIELIIQLLLQVEWLMSGHQLHATKPTGRITHYTTPHVK